MGPAVEVSRRHYGGVIGGGISPEVSPCVLGMQDEVPAYQCDAVFAKPARAASWRELHL